MLKERQKTPLSATHRIITLILLGLISTFGAVFGMNLETPRGVAQVSVNNTDAAEAPLPGLLSRLSAKPASVAPTPAPIVPSAVAAAAFDGLATRRLVIPVSGVVSAQLRDSFYDSRSEGRTHRAMDIMAPRDTPVIATDDGKVLKLHQSAKGGISLYQADASGQYVYFYGHLTRYADDITEGKAVKRGDVIAFVGDTGNAQPGNCHLHFGISRVETPGKWSGGEAINPYPILTGEPAASAAAGK